MVFPAAAIAQALNVNLGTGAGLTERVVQLVGLLTLHNGNVLAVSKALHTRRTQVYRWLQRFGIQVEAFRRRANT